MNLKNRYATCLVLLGLTLLGACRDDDAAALIFSAKSFLNEKATKEAIIQLKNALQKDPDSGEARYLLGIALLDQGDAKAAAIELGKAVALKQPPELTAPVMARALLAQKEYRKLLDSYALVDLAEAAAGADLKTSVATAHFALNQRPLGQAALNAALSLKPDHVAAHMLKARQIGARGDIPAALQVMEALLQQAPGSAAAWQLNAELQSLSRATLTQALGSYRKSLELGGARLEAYSGMITILLDRGDLTGAQTQVAAMKRDLPDHPQSEYFEAVLALHSKDFAVARRLSDKLINGAPSNPHYQGLAGTLAIQAEDLPRAEMLLAGAVQALPGSRPLRRLLTLTYLRNGKPAKALTTIGPMIEAAPPDAESMALAATAYLQIGEQKKAAAMYAAAARLKPGEKLARAAIAAGRLGGDDASTALSELEGVASSDAGSTFDIALISARIQRKEFSQALKAIEALEKKLTEHPLPSMLRGRVQLLQGQKDGARTSYERARALAPEYFPAYAALAELDLADKNPDAAKKRFETLLKMSPKNSLALMALAVLQEKTGSPAGEVLPLLTSAVQASPTNESARVLLIEHHLRLGDIRRALSAAQEGAAVLPSSAVVLAAWGKAAAMAGDANQAIKVFTQLVELQEGSPEPLLLLAKAQTHAKAMDAARQTLNRALTIKPDFVPTLLDLMDFEVANGRVEAAMNLARRLQTLRPNDSVGFVAQAHIHASQKQWDAAEVAYRKALKCNGNTSAIAADLHTMLRRAGKGVEAEKLASSWVVEHPRDALFLMHLGDQAMLKQDFAVAETHYLAALRINPEDGRALNNLAWLSNRLGRAGGLAFAEKAVALQPGNPAHLDTLAMLLAQNKEFPRALAVQRKAIELAPNDPMLVLGLAKLLVKSGDTRLARETLDSLSALGERFSGQAQVAQLRRSL